MGVTIRPATPADIPALLAIMGDQPSDEQTGICGDERRARRVRRTVNELLFAPKALPYTSMLVDEGDPVGLIQLGEEMGGALSFELVWMAIRVFGPLGIPGLLRRQSARARVNFEEPAGSLHIAEVHVREDKRGRGYGEQLLRHAEAQAVALGLARLSLTTTTANPARRLYERFGFAVVERKTDADYERHTGIEGRILMVKDVRRPSL